MANATVSRLGQVNAANDVKALFLKQFAGEVITSFNTATKFMDKHTVRGIKSGKSASFPATGKTVAEYHTPGEEITGDAINHAERIITIDDLLISHVFIANIDEAMNHYDVRAEYSRQLGDTLAQAFDKNVAQVGLNAARDSATITGQAGGTVIEDADYRTDGAALAAGFFGGAQALDENDVPDNDRWGAVLPAQYYLLAQETNVINRDWDGRGSFADGKVVMIAGIPVVKTNNLPQTDVDSGPTDYQGDFTNTAGLIWQRGAMGTVKLLDLAMEGAYDVRRQGTLMVAKYALGHGILRPHSAVELTVDDGEE